MDVEEDVEKEEVESHNNPGVIEIIVGEGERSVKLISVNNGQDDEEDDDDQDHHHGVVEGGGGGRIAYIQVEGTEMTESFLLQAIEGGSEEEEDGNEHQGHEEEARTVTLVADRSGTEYTTAIVEADGAMNKESGSMSSARCILQSLPNYKLELLQYISQDASSDAFLDFPVFCQDGVAWSNRLLLTSMSTSVKVMLLELGEAASDGACLVLPDLKRVEFATFHRALFAREEDASLDFVTLIKVAEMLGAELFLTTNFPLGDADEFPEVDYRSTMDNYHEREKIYRSLGYVVEGGGGGRSRRGGGGEERDALSGLLSSVVVCGECGKTFVDETSLRKHQTVLHQTNKTTPSGAGRSYECDLCEKSFVFAVSVKKHKWLAHRNVNDSPDPNSSVNASATSAGATEQRVSDKAAARLKRVKEKFEDMKCKICGTEATSWKQLQIHVMDHSRERPFKCATCGKGFKEPQKLRRHQVTHTGEKNHLCKFCGKAFGLRHNMKSHERIHLGQGPSCRYCGKMVSQVTNLREHEAVHAKKGHVASEDPKLRKSQELVLKKRGRPSIMALDKKREEEGEEEEVMTDNGKTKESVREEPIGKTAKLEEEKVVSPGKRGTRAGKMKLL